MQVLEDPFACGRLPARWRSCSVNIRDCSRKHLPVSGMWRSPRLIIEQYPGERPVSLEERARADSGLKTLANATSYGIFAEMIQKQGEPARVRVVGFDETFETTVPHPEDSGVFCYPPLGACVPASARLMLATLEKLISEQGGQYAVCDTDAMAIVATRNGGLVPCHGGNQKTVDGENAIYALSWEQVDQIRAQFQQLNPYDPNTVPDDLLELEKENFDKSGTRRELSCVATSAKRYALYQHTDRGIEIRKRSEHGLGHLLAPEQGEGTDWFADAWKILIAQIAGTETPEPRWLDQPAVAQLVATTPYLLRHFRHHNQQKGYVDQVKPFGFLLSATPRRVAGLLLQSERLHLIAPFERDPDKWLEMEWTDIYTGNRHRITTEINAGDPTAISSRQSDWSSRNGLPTPNRKASVQKADPASATQLVCSPGERPELAETY